MNQRITESKSAALPLGYTPKCRSFPTASPSLNALLAHYGAKSSTVLPCTLGVGLACAAIPSVFFFLRHISTTVTGKDSHLTTAVRNIDDCLCPYRHFSIFPTIPIASTYSATVTLTGLVGFEPTNNCFKGSSLNRLGIALGGVRLQNAN